MFDISNLLKEDDLSLAVVRLAGHITGIHAQRNIMRYPDNEAEEIKFQGINKRLNEEMRGISMALMSLTNKPSEEHFKHWVSIDDAWKVGNPQEIEDIVESELNKYFGLHGIGNFEFEYGKFTATQERNEAWFYKEGKLIGEMKGVKSSQVGAILQLLKKSDSEPSP